MSGGFFEYKDFLIDDWINEIELELLFHKTAKAVQEKNPIPRFPKKYDKYDENNEYDPDGYSFSYRKYLDIVQNKSNNWISKWSSETIKKVEKYLKILKKTRTFLHEFDWFISGDNSEETFLKKLKEQGV